MLDISKEEADDYFSMACAKYTSTSGSGNALVYSYKEWGILYTWIFLPGYVIVHSDKDLYTYRVLA